MTFPTEKISMTNSHNGLGFAGLLAVAFIVLKLVGKIDWSWWWVLSPIWIPALIALALVGAFSIWIQMIRRR